MLPRRLLLPVALLPGLLAGCSQKRPSPEPAPTEEAKEAFGRLTIDEVEAKMAEAKAGKLALAVIDNNPRTVFEQGHLPGAKWVKHTEVRAEDLPSNRDAMLVFYCSSEL